jgi:hypothetical protein
MKDYPSIPRMTLTNDLVKPSYHFFDKLDGSNLRFEWNPKRGWYKYGTRNHLFDESDKVFSPAIPLFYEALATPLDKIARENRWDGLVVFCEYWGPQSFAGSHVPGDKMSLTLFDAAPYKKGILGPEEFIKLFGHLNIPKYFGFFKLDATLAQNVSNGEFGKLTHKDGMTFEGVVGKSGTGHNLEMVKLKTNAWRDKVRSIYKPHIAEQILRS